MWYNILILVGFFLKPILSSNILFVNVVPSPSHQIWNVAYASGLAQKGHNVTMISPYVTKNLKFTNFHQIEFEGALDKLYSELKTEDSFSLDSTFKQMEMMYKYVTISCKVIIDTGGLQQLLNYPPDFKFDLIVYDITLFNGCLYPLIRRFNSPPTIGVTAFLLPSYVSHFFGNHLHTSYLPFYHLELGTHMNFFERLKNSFFVYLDIVFKYLYDIPYVENLHKDVFGQDVEPVEELHKHMTLVLSNSDPILGIPQPVTPNIIPVGGLHARPANKLPEDLQLLLDKAKNGVIVFSMGSNIRSDTIDVNVRKEILDAFSQLPYTILWKFESELEAPKNVIVKKWLPLNDILAHENVKLFISHGGALSTQEAMYHGVPVLGVPVFADQHINIVLMKNKKLATSIALNSLTSDSFKNKILETLTNQIYSKNMKDISNRFKGLPQTPLERAVQWSEYAMKHEGAHFLNTPARDLPFFVANGLDVISFLVFIVIVILLLLRCIIKKMLSFTSSSKIKRD